MNGRKIIRTHFRTTGLVSQKIHYLCGLKTDEFQNKTLKRNG